MKSTSSNSAVEKQTFQHGLKPLLILSSIACLLILLLITKDARQDRYIIEALSLEGSIDRGGKLFRMNCVGCHGITAQGLVGPELNKITDQINDKQIIVQIINGLTPPMPSFEMDAQSMSDLISYLHSLN